jgi:predicted histone-like DNA-binding protein
MALNYSVALRPNPFDKDASPKAYATAQINGELSLKQLSKRVSSQTTVSRADVVAVLTATVENLLEALCEGKQVDFGELGKFRLQIVSTGTETLADFTAAQITGVNIQYIPGEDLKTIFGALEFHPVASRAAQAAALRAEKEGKAVADLLKGKDEPVQPEV